MNIITDHKVCRCYIGKLNNKHTKDCFEIENFIIISLEKNILNNLIFNL